MEQPSVILARRALRGALEVRSKSGKSRSDPICVYDVAEQMNLEVRFHSGSSFEGMYVKDSCLLLVSASRPPGRQAYTCAHELGHWLFRHGTRADILLNDSTDGSADTLETDERLADIFAAFLLMPPWAVQDAFDRRALSPADCSPNQIYTVSSQLGVGYTSLVRHLQWTLKVISSHKAGVLLKTSPKQIREEITGQSCAHLVVSDLAWQRVPIDLRCGDLAVLPCGVRLKGKSVENVGEAKWGMIVQACSAGITQAVASDGWATFIRVSRVGFTGRSIYRHLEESNEDS